MADCWKDLDADTAINLAHATCITISEVKADTNGKEGPAFVVKIFFRSGGFMESTPYATREEAHQRKTEILLTSSSSPFGNEIKPTK